MPKKRISTRTSRQKAAAKVNLAKARKAAANARSANAHGATKAAGYSLKKVAKYKAAAQGHQVGKSTRKVAKEVGMHPNTMKKLLTRESRGTKTIEPKAHTRKKPRKANTRRSGYAA